MNRADHIRRIHRLSGVALAVYLPAHLFTLALALDESALDRMIAFGEVTLVWWAQAVLIALLCTHLAFGCRILIIEWAARRDNGPANMRLTWFWPAIGLACAVGLCYALAG